MIAAHAGRPGNAPATAGRGARTGALVDAADGGPQARQRHQDPARAAQARPQGGPRPDPRAAARAAGIPANGQGLRPAPGRAEVRPREGESHPHPLPDLAEQDDRRALRAPAQRARLVPAPIDTPVLVITGPSGVGKGTLIRGLLDRCPGLELAVSATTRAPRKGEQDGREYHFLSTGEFDRRAEAGDFVEHAVYAGNR